MGVKKKHTWSQPAPSRSCLKISRFFLWTLKLPLKTHSFQTKKARSQHLHPGKLTWNVEHNNGGLVQMIFFFQVVIFRFYVFFSWVQPQKISRENGANLQNKNALFPPHKVVMIPSCRTLIQFYTLQETDISHCGKMKIIFQSTFGSGYVSSQGGMFAFFPLKGQWSVLI